MIPLARPVIGDRERELVDEVLRSRQLSLGPTVTRFERMWAERKRMRGGFVAEVHSEEEAVEALARARTGARE